MPPPISILIRSFNSAKTLDRLLSRLDLEERDQVIVVDSGSTDATLEIATRHNADIIPASGPFNYSRSLNLGFEAARNEWVLVISSHSLPVHDHLLATYRRETGLFEEDVVAGYGPSTLSGKSVPHLDPEKTVFHDRGDYYRDTSVICGNANTIYRKRAWGELAFDETVRTAEDKIWIENMLNRGYRFAHIPKAPTINQNHGSLRYMFWKGYSDSMAGARSAPRIPMRLWHLGGGIKNLVRDWLKGDISFLNCTRHIAHHVGVFFGSRCKQNNERWS